MSNENENTFSYFTTFNIVVEDRLNLSLVPVLMCQLTLIEHCSCQQLVNADISTLHNTMGIKFFSNLRDRNDIFVASIV